MQDLKFNIPFSHSRQFYSNASPSNLSLISERAIVTGVPPQTSENLSKLSPIMVKFSPQLSKNVTKQGFCDGEPLKFFFPYA